MALKLSDVLKELGVSEAEEALAPHWEESEASYPVGGPRFLQADTIKALREFSGLAPESEEHLLRAARTILASPALSHLAWHCARLLYDCLDYSANEMRKWPILDAAMGEDSGLFWLLVMLEAIPRMRAKHEARGIPEIVSRQTCTHFTESARIYREHHEGRWGVLPRVLFWLRNHNAGELCCLGRMEYMVKPYAGHAHVYRNWETDEVVALAGDGATFTEQGFWETSPTGPTWTATLRVTKDHIIGYPMAPTGVAIHQEIALPANTWREVLKAGHYVLDTHIPAGGNMTPEACRDTMQQALDFFPKYFPERPFVGFACGSWILNPELEWIYRPDSNMVLWQRELYLYPIPSGPRVGLYFIFGQDDIDPATAPRDTSLRRAIADHLAKGGQLRAGGMFFLREDMDKFGTQFYRSQWPPSVMR
jgi:hypothetical protein